MRWSNPEDEFYAKKFEIERRKKDERYNQTIQEFENLSLEEKVNKLIEKYAFEMAYVE